MENEEDEDQGGGALIMLSANKLDVLQKKIIMVFIQSYHWIEV